MVPDMAANITLVFASMEVASVVSWFGSSTADSVLKLGGIDPVVVWWSGYWVTYVSSSFVVRVLEMVGEVSVWMARETSVEREGILRKGNRVG